MNGQIYLSGAMQHATDQNLGAGWRRECSAKLKEMMFVPLDITDMDVQYNLRCSKDVKCRVDSNLSPSELLQTKSNIRTHFIEADLKLIELHSDAVIVRYDDGVRKGAGTISECQYAYNLDIPIFLVNEYGSIADIPGWLYALTTRIFDSWDDLYSYFAALPPGILKRDEYGNRRSGTKYLCSLCGAVEEKHKSHFVSKVTPMYCKSCVDVVTVTHETLTDRYDFFKQYMDEEGLENFNGSN